MNECDDALFVPDDGEHLIDLSPYIRQMLETKACALEEICLCVHTEVHVLMHFFMEYDVEICILKINFHSPPPLLKQ